MNNSLSVFYNPTAGSGHSQIHWKEVRALLIERNIPFTILTKENIHTATRDIIVIGGDGTFNVLLNILEKPHLHRFIMLPAGTSNSLCYQISPKQTPIEKALHYLNNPTFTAIDLPQVTTNGKTYRFIVEASVGFAAAIAREIEQNSTKKFFNKLHLNELSYIATAFHCWVTDKPIMLSFCNTYRISGDVFPCVHAKPNDGFIDVYDLRCPRLLLVYELIRLVKARYDAPSPYVTRLKIKKNTWSFEKPLPVEIDANPIGTTTEITLSLYPERIEVL